MINGFNLFSIVFSIFQATLETQNLAYEFENGKLLKNDSFFWWVSTKNFKIFFDW